MLDGVGFGARFSDFRGGGATIAELFAGSALDGGEKAKFFGGFGVGRGGGGARDGGVPLALVVPRI